MTHWLTVLGGGTWSCGQYSYASGPHEVSSEIAEIARAEGYRWLVITDSDAAPALPPKHILSGPLSMTDIEEGTADHKERAALVDAPVVALPEAVTAPNPVVDLDAIRNDAGRISCPFAHTGCDKTYVAREALERHIDVKHGDEVAALAALAAATAPAEAASAFSYDDLVEATA